MNIDGLTEEKKNDIASIFKRNLIIIYMKCSYKFLIFFVIWVVWLHQTLLVFLIVYILYKSSQNTSRRDTKR